MVCMFRLFVIKYKRVFVVCSSAVATISVLVYFIHLLISSEVDWHTLAQSGANEVSLNDIDDIANGNQHKHSIQSRNLTKNEARHNSWGASYYAYGDKIHMSCMSLWILMGRPNHRLRKVISNLHHISIVLRLFPWHSMRIWNLFRGIMNTTTAYCWDDWKASNLIHNNIVYNLNIVDSLYEKMLIMQSRKFSEAWDWTC